MSRNRQRVPLEAGQRLDINRLRRDGLMPRDLHGAKAGSLRVTYPDGFEQEIIFVSRKRHLGGRQFYFVCPSTGRRCSVLWKPPGAKRFTSRQAWGKHRVAYTSQFAEPVSRCHLALASIRRRLGEPHCDGLPPRPKHMRARTYERSQARYERVENDLNEAWLKTVRAHWPHLEAFK